jgi:hypothetical protein
MEAEQPERNTLAHATSTPAPRRRLFGHRDRDDEAIDSSEYPICPQGRNVAVSNRKALLLW